MRKVRDKATGTVMAMKSYCKTVLRASGGTRQVVREVALHASIDHPAVVRALVAFEDRTHVHLCTEYLHGKSLLKVLDDADGRLTEREVAALVAAPLLKLLMLLHARGIVHRDITPSNIMMTGPDGTKAVLIDFGVAINSENERPRTVGGTEGHMAPEVSLPKDKFR